MQELYRYDSIVAYRLCCTCNDHEHTLDVEIDAEDGHNDVLVTFKEHICSRTRNFFWRLNAALFLLMGRDVCLREIVVDEEDANELAQVLTRINVNRMVEGLPGGVIGEATGKPG